MYPSHRERDSHQQLPRANALVKGANIADPIPVVPAHDRDAPHRTDIREFEDRCAPDSRARVDHHSLLSGEGYIHINVVERGVRRGNSGDRRPGAIDQRGEEYTNDTEGVARRP